MKVGFAGLTDRGRVRANNEDVFVAKTLWDEKHILLVVIDGVGGYEGGEVAAALAGEHIVGYLERYPNGERVSLLKQAVVYANNIIYGKRQTEGRLERMSCVLTAVLLEVDKGVASMAHVGDTRLYLYREGKIKKISHDHSYVGYLEENGELGEEEAMQHPQRNIINRDIGSEKLNTGDDYIETQVFDLLHGDILLLCSDGLYDMLPSVKVSEILGENVVLEKKAEELVVAANLAGGKDNITVLLAFCEGVGEEGYQKKRSEEKETLSASDAMAPASYAISSKSHHNCRMWVWIAVISMFLVGFWAGLFSSRYLSKSMGTQKTEKVCTEK